MLAKGGRCAFLVALTILLSLAFPAPADARHDG